MQINFQAGVEDIYDACVAKGSTPVSTSLSDVVAGIMAIPTGITPSGTYTYPANSTGTTVDVTQYQYVNASNVYAKGKTDGRSLSTQSRSATLTPQYTTFTFSFPTKVVGVYNTTCTGWICGYIYSISGNTVTIKTNGSSGNSFTVYAYGY